LITPAYFLVEHLFSERSNQGLIFILIIASLVLFMLGQVSSRACFASQMKRVEYGLVAPADSLLRLVVVGVFLSFGVRLTPLLSLTAMAIGTAVVALVAVCTAAKVLPKNFHRSNPDQSGLVLGSFDFSFLLVGTIAMTCFISGLPLIARLFSHLTNEEIGLVGAALMIARVPLLLIMGFESILVHEFHRRLTEQESPKTLTGFLAVFSLCLGLVGGVFGLLFGPWLVQKIAGPDFSISAQSMAAFSVATGLTIGASLLTPLCIALNLHRYIARAWVFSLFTFLPSIAILGHSVFQVAISFAISSGVCVILLALSAFKQESSQLKGIDHE
jgi:O-antigen/teichoic acid export membrane protein